MSALVKSAKAATNSFEVQLAKFLLAAKKEGILICVFEGQDHQYYGPRIDSVLPSSVVRYDFSANGKYNVLRLYALRDTNVAVKAANAIFFTDRDFDFDLNSEPGVLYVTPTYSIENFYVSDAVFKKLLQEVFDVASAYPTENGWIENDESTRICEKARKIITHLNSEALICLNAFVLAAKKFHKADHSQKLKLWDLNIEEMILVSFNNVQLKADFSYAGLKKIFPECNEITLEHFEESKAVLNTMPLESAGRGKFILPGVASLLKEIFDDARKNRPQLFARKRIPRCTYSKETILSDLSSYAETPTCLRSFLSQAVA